MDKDVVKEILEKNGYEIVFQKRYKNCGYRLKEKSGTAIFCYDKGTYSCKGRNSDKIDKILSDACPKQMFNKKVFVVYGHDDESRVQLENLLLNWNLEPLMIDRLPTQGRTIIEQLEKYIPEANFGIVLVTPDDIGYSKNEENNKRFRARQNVILELGMLLSKLGRSRVAVIIKNVENIEKPSDIHGILYHPYNEKIEEIALKLSNELRAQGYNIVA